MKGYAEWNKSRLNALIDVIHDWPGRLVKSYAYQPKHTHGALLARVWNLPRPVVSALTAIL